ncbi:MAG TPA: LysR family transcriptional regulator [Myxococcaceae bacterium]|nr:LysR family transcriptional regulator [Myxococcaceae bacterium]
MGATPDREADLFDGVVPFVTAARAQNFREAARRLGLTPSAVSKAIKRLEDGLGVRLFNRTSRSVELTEEGQAFLKGCQDAVSSLAAVREHLSQLQRAPRGRLTVSLPLTLGRLCVMPAVPRLLAAFPGLSVQAILTDRFVHLTDEGVDAAVRIGEPLEPGLVTRRLGTVRWVTVASPSYLARQGTPRTPADLRDHNCLKFLLQKGTLAPWEFTDAKGTRVEGASSSGNLTSDHGEGLVEAALGGLGLVQAHDYFVADRVGRGELVEVLKPFAAPGPPISLILAPKKRSAPKVRAFADFVVGLLAGRR